MFLSGEWKWSWDPKTIVIKDDGSSNFTSHQHCDFCCFGYAGSSLLCTGFLYVRQVGLLLIAVHGLLIAAVSLVAKHGLQKTQSLVVVAHKLSCSTAHRIFLHQGSNRDRTVSPALAGRFLITGPPGKSSRVVLSKALLLSRLQSPLSIKWEISKEEHTLIQ